MSNKDQAPFDIPDPEAAGWKEDPDRPGYWLWETEVPVTEAPTDGAQYGRQMGDWTEIVIPPSLWQGNNEGISTNAFRAVVGEENVEGVGLYATGMIRVWESTQNSNYLWSGYGGGSITSHIQADGDAKFAGNVDLLSVGRFGRASLGFDTNVVFGRGSNDLPTGVDLGNASYKWNNAHFDGTVTATSFVGDGSQLTGIDIPDVDLTGYAKYSDNPAQFDGTLYATKLQAGPLDNGTNAPTIVLERVPEPNFGLKPAIYSPEYKGCGLLFQSGNSPTLFPTNESGHVTSNLVSLGSNAYRFSQAHVGSLYVDGTQYRANTLYYYLSTTQACPEKTNPQLRMGRSASQYCTFGGTSGGNWLHSASDAGNPKQNFYITVGVDNGSTVAHTYTFNSGALTLQTDSSFVTTGNGGWLNATHGGGWNQTDATWIRAYGGKAVYVANSGANAIATAGDVVAYYSDERLKDVQGPIENPLDKVDAIDTFYYTHNDLAKSLGYEGDEVQVGVSAQSVKAVMPEVVCRAPVDMDADGGSLSGEDYMTVKYERLVPLLLESIKELRKEIEELKRG